MRIQTTGITERIAAPSYAYFLGITISLKLLDKLKVELLTFSQ